MALYLKYRPQSLDELIGQEAVKKILLAAYQAHKLSHAYLLVGSRGTGKTSTARILAKMVNCELLDDSDVPEKDKINQTAKSSITTQLSIPCNKCSSCLSITDGSNLDLIEIDAASNRGIDDIRTLRENIKLSPSGNKKKVYIIDEVHMLTMEAFNALLKTLEEPPAHALFILATTEVGKIPQTILSRVQRLDFKLASSGDLMISLKRIIDGEKIKIEEEALKILVKKADGSFRDCAKLLDQVSSREGQITAQDVVLSLRTTKFADAISLLEKLAEKNTQEAILEVNKMIETGADVKSLVLTLMDYIRTLMLIKNDLGSQLVENEYDSDQYLKLKALADRFNIKEIGRSLEVLQEALERLKFASILSLPLELAAVKITSEGQIKSDEIRKSEVSEPVIQKIESKKEILTSEEEVGVDNSTVKMIVKNSGTSELSTINDKWTFILETIRPYNFSLEALLRSVKITQCQDGVVTLEVPYSFHQRILETPKSRDLLESILSDVLGKSTKVATVLGQRPVRVEDVANVEIAADDEIIRAASEIFEGSLVD